MKAVIQDRYGTSEVLRVGDVAVPEPGDQEVLIKVHAAGLDRGTEHLMTGKPYAMRMATGLRRPKNPISGRDVAGTVVKVGSAVTRFAAGDQVYGVAPGSFAEYAVGPENKLAHKPANLTFSQAAVVPISAGTALQALRDSARSAPGRRSSSSALPVASAATPSSSPRSLAPRSPESPVPPRPTSSAASAPTTSSTTTATTSPTAPATTTSSSTSAAAHP